MRLPSIRTELLPARTRAAYNGWISPAENTDPEYLYSTQQEMILAEVCYPRSVQELYVFLKSTYLRRAVRFKEGRPLRQAVCRNGRRPDRILFP